VDSPGSGGEHLGDVGDSRRLELLVPFFSDAFDERGRLEQEVHGIQSCFYWMQSARRSTGNLAHFTRRSSLIRRSFRTQCRFSHTRRSAGKPGNIISAGKENPTRVGA
jgi:hypothetical protein